MSPIILLLQYQNITLMYYKLNGKVYGNKLEGLISAQEKTGSAHNLEFIPHSGWDSYNWLNEPEESWEEILREHALNLRTKYSYLRLWYSGGVDSQTILNTFIKYNIHLDEIAITRNSPIDRSDTLENGETNWVAIPFLKAHRRELARTKINIIDMGSREYYKYYSNEKSTIENHNNLDYEIPVGVIAYGGIVPDKIRPQKNAANITGIEKPIIGLDENGFYLYYIDTIHFWNSKYDPNLAEESLENFYLEPKVQSKQCHMVKNFCKENGGECLKTLAKGERLSLLTTDAICRDPLYIPYSTGKGTDAKTAICGIGFKLGKVSRLYSNSVNVRTFKDVFRENLTLNSNSNLLDINYEIISTIEEIVKNKLGTYWFNNKDNIRDGIVGKISKKYYIEYGKEWFTKANRF